MESNSWLDTVGLLVYKYLSYLYVDTLKRKYVPKYLSEVLESRIYIINGNYGR